jgi:hypothetical protein
MQIACTIDILSVKISVSVPDSLSPVQIQALLTSDYTVHKSRARFSWDENLNGVIVTHSVFGSGSVVSICFWASRIRPSGSVSHKYGSGSGFFHHQARVGSKFLVSIVL